MNKKLVNFAAANLLIYTLIINLTVISDYFFKLGLFRLSVYFDFHKDLFARLVSDYDIEAWSSIAGVSIGFLVLYKLTRPFLSFDKYIQKNKKMTSGIFLQLIAVMLSAQYIFSIFDKALEFALNKIGLSALSSVEAATLNSTTFSMLIYSCIAAPVFEELIYRGFCMRIFEKGGKKFAIIISAMLFGIMHANIPQGFFAFYIGLVLGYTAMEYSIIWSILLHFINNAIIGEGLELLIKYFPDRIQALIYTRIFLSFTVAAFIVIAFNFKLILVWCRQNKTKEGSWRLSLSSILVIIFIIINLVPAIASLTGI